VVAQLPADVRVAFDRTGLLTRRSRAVPALTYQQPWGWAVVRGWKPVENRTWQTAIRGPVLVHQGKSFDEDSRWFGPLMRAPVGTRPGRLLGGVILGGATLTDCHRAEVGCCESEWAMPGLWHWVLADPWALREPVPARGQLGWWWPPDEVMAAVRAATPRCCDLHNEHCEPPSDLCCDSCAEAGHPDHLPGVRCVLDRTPAAENEPRWGGQF
jgi:hypothetical protein